MNTPQKSCSANLHNTLVQKLHPKRFRCMSSLMAANALAELEDLGLAFVSLRDNGVESLAVICRRRKSRMRNVGLLLICDPNVPNTGVRAGLSPSCMDLPARIDCHSEIVTVGKHVACWSEI
jgi:hypothetical protein